MSKGYMHSPDSHAMHALRWHLPKQQQIPKTFQSKIPFPCRPSCLLELSTAGMLFNCFTSPASSHGPKEAHKEDDLRYEIRRIRSKEAFERTIQRANARGVQVVVEWAANWCSLCLEADLEFAQFAADLKAEQHQDIQLVRVNLDKAEELAIDYKIITLPSFSIFNESEHVEHYTGLESCKVMHKRLQLQSREQGSLTLLEAIDDLGEQQDMTSTALESIDWDVNTCSTHSDCTASLHDSGAALCLQGQRNSLDATSQYLPKYKRRRAGSMDSEFDYILQSALRVAIRAKPVS